MIAVMRDTGTPQDWRLTQILEPFHPVPVLVGHTVRLGQGGVLARIAPRAGLWQDESPSDPALAAMFSAAYGRRIEPTDRPVRAIREAVLALLAGRPCAAEDALSGGRFDAIDGPEAERLFEADVLLKAGIAPRAVLAKLVPNLEYAKEYNPDEPRDERGRWTDGESAGTISSGQDAQTGNVVSHDIDLVAYHPPATEAEKEKFIDDHLQDAQKLADKLHVPVENILGLSALESDWGRSRFAIDGNNLLGIHYPAPFATGYIVAGESKAKVATFASYQDCLDSFAQTYGKLVYGISDPAQFATLLQNSNGFGIYPDGSKRKEYVPGVAATIRGFRVRVARRRA